MQATDTNYGRTIVKWFGGAILFALIGVTVAFFVEEKQQPRQNPEIQKCLKLLEAHGIQR